MTHPCHPLAGQEVAVLCVYRRQGSEGSLVVQLPEGSTQCLPVAWTDRAAPNPHALGHAPGARLSGLALLEVLHLLEAWHQEA
ncbi:MAG: DUF5372 family protein [Gemmatimonadales bacterium]